MDDLQIVKYCGRPYDFAFQDLRDKNWNVLKTQVAFFKNSIRLATIDCISKLRRLPEPRHYYYFSVGQLSSYLFG
jgi:hypothetical protein